MKIDSFLGTLSFIGEFFVPGAFILVCFCLLLLQCCFTSGLATIRGFGLFPFQSLPPDLVMAGYGNGDTINDKSNDESQKVYIVPK